MGAVVIKVIIEHSNDYEKQFIIKCSDVDEEVENIKLLVESYGERLEGRLGDEIVFIKPAEIYYFEYVDYNVFAYTSNNVYKIAHSLDKLEKTYAYESFFRCSKSMIINLNHVEKLKSIMGNKIIATLDNNEEIIISRHFSKMIRAYLKAE
ncbi:MAG: LytTR family DNA-binding domain-containing protein [Lachnotalea sp.]